MNIKPPLPKKMSKKCYPNCRSLISLMLFYFLLREYMISFKEARDLAINLRLVYQSVSEVSSNSYMLLPNILPN